MVNVPVEFFRDNVKRYRQLIAGKRPDWAPFRCWLDNFFCCAVAETDPADYARDFEVQLNVQRAVNERFCNVFDMNPAVDISGIWFDTNLFRTENPGATTRGFLNRDLKDFDRYHNNKSFDDLDCVKRLHEGIRYFNQRLPKDKRACYYLGLAGCLDMFSCFRGTQEMFMDLYDNPKQVHRIFSWMTQRNLDWMEYCQKHWGVLNEESILYDKIDIGEDYCAYLPPEMFDEFVKPYTGKLFEAYKGKALRSLHTDGDFLAENLNKLNELGIDELMGFTPHIEIKQVRKALPDIILAGNIHPIEVMMNGTPEDVKASVRYCFENAAKDGKFVLCTGGAIGYGAKPENVDAFLESAYEICKY